MRKVTEQIKQAFFNKQALKVNNTRTDGNSVWLHGNEIIKRDPSGVILFTFSGWGFGGLRFRWAPWAHGFGDSHGPRPRPRRPRPRVLPHPRKPGR